jgi:hypothetical protein
MPSSTFTFFRQFKENLGKGVHNFTADANCTVTLALCNAANAPVNTNEILANLTTIAYTNLSTRVLTGITFEQVAGTATFTFTDHVLTASGGAVAPFRYIVFYDDDPTSPADPLIGYLDYGSDLTLADTQTLTIDGGASGAFTLA